MTWDIPFQNSNDWMFWGQNESTGISEILQIVGQLRITLLYTNVHAQCTLPWNLSVQKTEFPTCTVHVHVNVFVC